MRQRFLTSLLTPLLVMALTGCGKDAAEEGSYDAWTDGLVTVAVGDNLLYFVPTADRQGMMLTYDRTKMTFERLVQMNGGTVGEEEGGTGEQGLVTYQGVVNIPTTVNGKSVKAIDQYAFSGNYNLTSVVVPNSVTEIGPESFAQCPNLTSVSLPQTISTIKAGTFCGKSVPTITIPKSVKTLGRFAFLKNTLLTTVTFETGSQLEAIEASAFSGCTALPDITLPDGIKTLGAYAFNGCTAIKELTIPASVTTIDDQCFKGCSRLKTIHMQSATPPTVKGSAAFLSSAVIYVPAGSLTAYQQADYWNTISSENYKEEGK